MSAKVTLRFFDVPALILSAAAAAVSLGFALKPETGAPQVRIAGPDSSWVFPLDADETVSVNGPLGVTVIGIHGGQCRVLSSPCPNQTCTASPPARKSGQSLVCLPNRVSVIISGEGDVDAGAW